MPASLEVIDINRVEIVFKNPNLDKPKPKNFKREGRKAHEVIQIKT